MKLIGELAFWIRLYVAYMVTYDIIESENK